MDWSDWKAYCRRCLAASYCQVQLCAWQNPANRRRSSGRSFTRSMSALQARDGSANWGCLRRHCSRHYWSTTAARDLRYIQIHSEQFFFHETIFFRDYMSTRQPSAKQKEIISLIVCFYIPNYFHIKTNPTIQDGAQNIFFMLTLSKELKPGSRATVERVLQGNSFFAHHENILIGMLRDENEEVRRQAVLYIRQRKKLNFRIHKT